MQEIVFEQMTVNLEATMAVLCEAQYLRVGYMTLYSNRLLCVIGAAEEVK